MTCIIAIETATEACSAALLLQQGEQLTVYKRFQLAPREHTKLILPMLGEILAEAEMQIADVDAIAFGRGPGAFTGLRIATGIAQGLALSIDKPTIAISSLTTMALAAQKEHDSRFNQSNDKDSKAKDSKEKSSLEKHSNISILVAIDARMGEVYWAEYKVNADNNELQLIGEEKLSKPLELFEKTQSLCQSKVDENQVLLIGSGWDVYFGEFQDDNPDYNLDNNLDNLHASDKIDRTALQHFTHKFPDAEEVSQLALLAFNKGELQSAEEAQPVYLRNNVAEKSKK